MTDSDIIDAKVAAAEARTDAKFAELRGEMKLMNADLSSKLDKILLLIAGSENKLAGIDGKFADLDGKFAHIDGKFADLDGKFARIDGKFADIDSKFAGIDGKFAEQDKKITELRAEMKTDFRASRALVVAISGLILVAGIAAFTYGGNMFARGMSVRDLVKATATEVLQQQLQRPSAPSKTP